MRSFVRAFIAITALTGATMAQPTGPQSNAALPPVRTLGRKIAASTELLGAVSQVRALPDGRVLVNDNFGRKVVLFDKTLQSFTVVADTTSATANAYSSRAGGLITYKGDSTLFVDPQSLSMLVIDGKGAVTRVMAIPRPNDAPFLTGGGMGTPGFDAQGRLVMRGAPDMQRMMQRMAGGPPGSPNFRMPELPDSMTVVRINLETRQLDTVANLKIMRQKMNMTQTPEGGMRLSQITNPLQYIDDWAVTADGRVAVIRGQEYRIEFIDANGKAESSAKLPFAWTHLTDSMKVAVIDSSKAAAEKQIELARQRMLQNPGGGPVAMGDGGRGGGAGDRMVMEFRVAGAEPARAAAPGAANGAPNRPQNISIPAPEFVPPSELPDYAPPFTAGSARGDADGNVWIRTTLGWNGGAIYDIVNGKGQLTDRVLVPTGRVIAGFGPGVVYMGYRDGAGVRLEAMAIRDGATIATKQ